MEKKQLSKKKVELLAPAGDLQRCKTAIRYGADAVYIGGQSFSLRSRASNFTLDDIEEACKFAKEYGARIHVTVNAINHDEDYDGLKEYLIELEKRGVSAIIVASLAVMKLAKEVTKNLEVHCSTQLSITNHESANFLIENFGADRVVLARECTLENVKDITNHIDKETEAFIHGGMCVNYSGRCTLSNRMTLRDANRGGCAQSCRWQYHLYDNKEISDGAEFTMGSKDLCAASAIEDLIHAGVASFKIEGRMKTEYYVATIVSAYRNLIDAIEEKGSLTNEELAYHQKQILYGENREVWEGFYHNAYGENSIIHHATSNVDVNHDFLCTVKKYNPETNTAIIETRNVFEVGEEIEILSPRKPIRKFILEKAVDKDGNIVNRLNQPMKLLEIDIPFAVKENDIIRRAR